MTMIQADALDLLEHVQMGTVTCVVTSVPYLKQRLYGNDPREAGTEETLAAYVKRIGDIFDQVRYAMRPEGTVWLNIGDKANGSGGAGGDWRVKHRKLGKGPGAGPGKFNDPAFQEGSYIDVPGAVLAELLRRGWRCRQQIIWDKGREAPEDLEHVKRPRLAHEMIYMLVPSPRYRRKGDARHEFWPARLKETGSVWHFPPGSNPNTDSHLAPFPDELARRCISPSSNPGDLVLDPFAGSGTTVRVAELMGRRGIGLDLYAGSDIPREEIPADVTPDPLTSGDAGFVPSNEEEELPISTPSPRAEEPETLTQVEQLIAAGERAGIVHRVELLEAWQDDRGNFDCYRLLEDALPWTSWTPGFTSPGGMATAEQLLEAQDDGCRPTLLHGQPRTEGDHHRWRNIYRGACLGCDWEGPVHDDENSAVEDAHDHVYPTWWRDLPTIKPPPGADAKKAHEKAMAKVVELYEATVPGCTSHPAGCPVWTWRNPPGTRHVPGRGLAGGYDLGRIVEPTNEGAPHG